MSAQASVLNAFTFIGGLNTEGGYFIIPENSYIEGVNVIPQIDGTLERRNGIDYESNYALDGLGIFASEKDLYAFTTGIWNTVAGNGNLDFIVVQTGSIISFYSAFSGSISPTLKSFRINLLSYPAPGNTEHPGSGACTFASTYGRLIITNENSLPILVTYDEDTDSISVEAINIETRDFVGKELKDSSGNVIDIAAEYTEAEWVALGVSIDDVKYNLYNQGWTDEKIDAYREANGGTSGDPTNGKYPANTKSWIYGKDTNDDFDAAVLNKQDFGNSPAPKGHYIINPFDGVKYRPKVSSFFAGRVWYAGIPTSKLLGTVLFSRVLTDINNAGKCYQNNDPTSEVISDLQDDDGGTIEIPDVGEIVALQPVGRGIMVLASNGVWFVSGIDQGFTASNYAVTQVSNVGCVNGKTVVMVEDTMLFWSTSGIYAVSAPNGVEYVAKNISEQAIKTFYKDIPTLGKLYAEGAYNGSDKVVYWLYSTNAITSTSSGRYNKDTVLAFDVRLNSWYWFELDSTTGVIPTSIETTKETTTEVEEYDVVVGANNVYVGIDQVVANLNVTKGGSKQFKIMCLHPVTSNNYSVTFADFLNTRDTSTKFKDWYTFNNTGVEKTSYFITGYNLGGNGPARTQTGQYLHVFMKRTETVFDANANPVNPSGCLMQSRWDFTDNSYPGKWSVDTQIYRHLRPFFVNGGADFDDGYPLVITKNKLRGRGKSVQFKFTSEEGKDMKIVGWSGTFVGNTNV